ncbi:MAG: DUF5682 family protein [Myxococcaceae bacterium]
MAELANIFGVRHFSPAAALLLRRYLEEKNPKCVLIEGPSDATEQLKHLAHKKTRPPVAVLAFTKTRPVRHILYPMAAYSPEWVALQWALAAKREVRFIDLPASCFLELHKIEEKPPEPAEGEDPDQQPAPDETQAYLDDPYDAIAQLAGEVDHETWWERTFEHLTDVAAYRESIFEFGKGLRSLRQRSEAWKKENELREAYMRREIQSALTKPSDGVVVCGAFHAAALDNTLPPMTDAEAKALPNADCVLTLMPYSYVRLSAQSGYGAGNHAPAYFEALYEEGVAGTPQRRPARYFSEIAAKIRKEGLVRSSAEVIEAVRLAEGMAALNGGTAPALRDLRDCARTLLGQGELLPIEKAVREVEIGTAIGTLPPGVSRTALQDDFHQLVKTLGLTKYLEDKEQKLELDLREDRRAKSADKAFLDRHRSTFLSRLQVLDIGFASQASRDQKGTAKESWNVRWVPECEIRLAERSLQADSIEMGAAYVLAERLKEAVDVGSAAKVLLQAAECELHDALGAALRRVQELAVDDGAFVSIGAGVDSISELIRYGSVRDVDPAPLRPVLQQLFGRGCLVVFGACICDDDAAKGVRIAMDQMQTLAFLGEEGIEDSKWIASLLDVSASDSRNPYLSGYAAALLIERGKMSDEEIDREVARRLSPGADASLGVGWFEGLVQRNRAALFMRKPLWSSLSSYVDGLDDEAFKRALLYLRRAFSTFDMGEIRRVVGVLAEVWKGGDVQALAAAVEKKLDQADIEKAAADLEGLDLL